ncbi:Hcp family type VI secretion system effector [Vibrio owensii]
MASQAFMKIESLTAGCLTSGCNSFYSVGNSYQSGHEDEITVLACSHTIAYDNRAIHQPVEVIKKIDKSSPVLNQACTDGQELTCTITYYRPTDKGTQEPFYEMKLTGALIRSVSMDMPHSIDFNEKEMQEVVTIAYRDIQWRHISANTAAYSTWLEPLKQLAEKFE